MTIRDLDRPQRFEDVYGQEEVIKVLGALAAKRVHRNLLLHGHFGSGKTTLVRIQARAWNCDAPDPETGSPCGDCEWCGKPLGSFLMEHDVAGDGGNEKVIKEVLAELAQRPLPAGKVTTVFFDEASHLTEGGCMVLLKRVEDAEENNESIVFCFATTDPERLLPQLRSRLLGLEVQALSDDAAIRYADAVVKKNGLLVEPDALALIARIESTAPRNIFRRIMRLTFTNRDTVTIGRVKLIFGLMHLDILPQLLLAIVQGDLQAQASLIAGWNIPAKDKARWLRSFIAAVYFNDILGLRITIDAKLDGISGLVRQKLVNELVATVHVDRPARLATIFERMLAYWSDLRQVRHSSDLWDGLQQFNRILSQEGEALEVAGPGVTSSAAA